MCASDLTLNILVPALLKRWKRLQSGLDLSAEAFVNLSKRFKEQNRLWLAEDKAAQRTRHNSPDAMDIYDTFKTQGIGDIPYISDIIFLMITSLLYLAPTRAMIQQGLISEELEEGTIHGQTSWLSCGLKIQEMQYA